MALIPIDSFIGRAEDPFGTAIPNSQLYVYQTGTTTQAPVYTDSGGGTVVSQPLLADIEGRYTRDSGGHTFATPYMSPGFYDRYSPADAVYPTIPFAIPNPSAFALSMTTQWGIVADGTDQLSRWNQMITDLNSGAVGPRVVVVAPDSGIIGFSGEPIALTSNDVAFDLRKCELRHLSNAKDACSFFRFGSTATHNARVSIIHAAARLNSAHTRTYRGTWNAQTNTPTLVDGTGTTGDVWKVDPAMSARTYSRNLGSGSQTFERKDTVIYDGTKWVNHPSVAQIDIASCSEVYVQDGISTVGGLGIVSLGTVAPVDNAPSVRSYFGRFTGSWKGSCGGEVFQVRRATNFTFSNCVLASAEDASGAPGHFVGIRSAADHTAGGFIDTGNFNNCSIQGTGIGHGPPEPVCIELNDDDTHIVNLNFISGTYDHGTGTTWHIKENTSHSDQYVRNVRVIGTRGANDPGLVAKLEQTNAGWLQNIAFLRNNFFYRQISATPSTAYAVELNESTAGRILSADFTDNTFIDDEAAPGTQKRAVFKVACSNVRIIGNRLEMATPTAASLANYFVETKATAGGADMDNITVLGNQALVLTAFATQMSYGSPSTKRIFWANNPRESDVTGDAELDAIAALTSAADKIPYFTGSGTASLLTRDTDGTLAANSDTTLATQKATKTYADTKIPASTYRLLVNPPGGALQAPVANVYAANGTNLIYGTSNTGNQVFYLNPALYAVSGLTTTYLVTAAAQTNATATTVNFTVGLYPVTASAGATASVVSTTLGTVTAGSTVAFNAPAASSAFQGTSGDFTAPAAGYYTLGIACSGTAAANSAIGINVRLLVRNV